MKSLLPAIIILTLGTNLFYALHKAGSHHRLEASATRQAWLTQTELLAQARIQLTAVKTQVQDLENLLKEIRPPSSLPSWASLTFPSAEQSEKLLDEMGFNWNSTGDYLVVSKATLGVILLKGMHGFTLNDIPCQVLAITPNERLIIESLAQNLGANCANWVKEHAQRDEPSGDILARYTLPADLEFFQSLTNNFANGLVATLGRERGNLLFYYSRERMMKLGDYGAGLTSLTVKRCQLGHEPSLAVDLRSQGITYSSSVGGAPPFPEYFQPLFPNGWSDLANREGFEQPMVFGEPVEFRE